MDQQERERQQERQPNTPEPPEPKHTTVEFTSPIWRVVAVALTAGFITAIGFYLDKVGHGDDFATVAVVAAVYTVLFWARKRPDQVSMRFGPFSKIANAIVESQDDLREWVLARPLRVGFAAAVCYGIALVIAKTIVVGLIGSLYSWELAVAGGCIIGALAAAPGLFAKALTKLSGPPERPREEDSGEDSAEEESTEDQDGPEDRRDDQEGDR